MNKKLYLIFLCAFALATLACSDDSVTGSSDVALSSSSLNDLNSSSAEKSSSSSAKAVLCKTSGGWGCIVSGFGDLWSLGEGQVSTKVYAEDTSKFGNHAGEFFVETDSLNGGKSTIEWYKYREGNVEYNSRLLRGVVYLDKGEQADNPFIDIGFNVAGFDSNGTALSADVSSWNGICIIYGGDLDVLMQLDLGESVNQRLGYMLPSVTLKPQGDSQCYEWNQFKQPFSSNEHEVISGDEAAKKVVRVVIRFQASSGEYFFDILAIGTNREE